MKSLQLISYITLLSLLTGCSSQTKHAETGLLTEGKLSGYKLKVSNGSYALFAGKGSDRYLEFTCDGKSNAPSVILYDKDGSWRFSRYNYLAADITNPGRESVLVEMRLDADGWLNQGVVVPAGETKTLRIDIPQDSLPGYYQKKIIGIYNLPNGIIKTDQKTDSIHKISFLIICPSGKTAVHIANIRGEGSLNYPSEKELKSGFFPLVDEFGQYRHGEWALKTHDEEELKKSAEDEQSDLQNHPEPSDRDRYGGWIKGPHLKATGNFRTEKVNGKWWFVDPDGYLFWSHGMGSVNLDEGDAVITDREFYFTGLPDSVRYRDFYRTGWKAPFGYYKDRVTRSFDEIAWNMFRKYGAGWKEKVIDLAPVRLLSWGQNTYGAWSSPEIYLKSALPYTPIIMIGSRKLEGSEGHWYKYADPYDSSLIGNLTRKIKVIIRSAADPFCIGYFVDNEITWGDSTGVARWTIASPPDQPAKIEMVNFLKRKYHDIERMNKNWGTGFKSWDDFMSNTRQLNIRNKDTQEFTFMAVNEYFKRVKSTLKKYAPGKLYLGPRLDYHFYPSEEGLNDWDYWNNWIVNIAAEYCDVVSFNRYRHSAADLRPGEADKPVLIGEWHHTPLEKGSFYMNQEHFAKSLQMRAEKYDYFIQSCLENPYIVGAHYFQFLDQPTVGRADGENFSCGFLNICDRPYQAMVAVSRKTGKEMYQKRYSK